MTSVMAQEMINVMVQAITAISATICLSHGFSTLIRMNYSTNHGVRAAFILLSTGAFGELALILGYGHVPSLAETLLMGGVGMLALFGRRERQRAPNKGKFKLNYGRRGQDFLSHLKHPSISEEK